MRRNTGSQQMWFLSKCKHADTQRWHAHTHLTTYSSSEISHQFTCFIITYSCHVTIKKYLIVILYTCPYLLLSVCLVELEFSTKRVCHHCLGIYYANIVVDFVRSRRYVRYTERFCNWLYPLQLLIVSLGVAMEFLQLSSYYAVTLVVEVWVSSFSVTLVPSK